MTKRIVGIHPSTEIRQLFALHFNKIVLKFHNDEIIQKMESIVNNHFDDFQIVYPRR